MIHREDETILDSLPTSRLRIHVEVEYPRYILKAMNNFDEGQVFSLVASAGSASRIVLSHGLTEQSIRDIMKTLEDILSWFSRICTNETAELIAAMLEESETRRDHDTWR